MLRLRVFSGLVKCRGLGSLGLAQARHKADLCEFKNHEDLFVKVFGLDNAAAVDYINGNRMALYDTEQIMKTVEFSRNVGFNLDELLIHPSLIRRNPITLEQRYMVLEEGGFACITPGVIKKFLTIQAKTIHALKDECFISLDTDVAASFVKYLNPCPEGFYIKNRKKDKEQWSKVHYMVLTEYLKWRLDATQEQIDRLAKIQHVERKCFRYLCENIAICEELGFSKTKMLKNGYVLCNYPKYTRATLERFPMLAGTNIRKAMINHPKLVGISPTCIEKIYNMLKENGISDDAISRGMNVFCHSPETVQYRLLDLQRTSELKVLQNDPNVLQIITHQLRAKNRLRSLINSNIKCVGVGVLGGNDENFHKHMVHGKDANARMEVNRFISDLLGVPLSHPLFARLKKHGRHLVVPFTDMKTSWTYLKEEKFEDEVINDVPCIILYPKEDIEAKLKYVKSKYERSLQDTNRPQLTQTQMLNLVTYLIEKETDFLNCQKPTKREVKKAE